MIMMMMMMMMNFKFLQYKLIPLQGFRLYVPCSCGGERERKTERKKEMPKDVPQHINGNGNVKNHYLGTVE
jgi:hypothetical protein